MHPDICNEVSEPTTFDDWLEMRFPEASEERKHVYQMLDSSPVEAGPDIVKIWSSMRRLTIKLLFKFWLKVDKTAMILEPLESCYEDWVEAGVKHAGMRNAISG